MDKTSTLNKVFDSILDDDKINITQEELETAITEQIKKVLYFICNPNEYFEMSIVTLYLLLMVKHKKAEVDDVFPEFGISNPINRNLYEDLKKKAFVTAKITFNDKIKQKI